MFDSLSERLSRTLKNLRGEGRLTEENMKNALREVRISLLEADVALPVVKSFIEHIRERALGTEVSTSVNPGQAVVKIVNDELIETMGRELVPLNFSTQPPAVFLVAGLQGAGKTTSVAKLSLLLKERDSKKVLVTSADIYRPAAITQLERLAQEVGVDCFPSTTEQKPIDIAKAAIEHAKKQFHDVVIIDTAGRLHVDDEMMQEIKQLHDAITPIETLFVVDSMTGQDAANSAKAFNDVLPLTGVVLTKTDGDSRGGAALSVRHITGQPIKFIGTGEKIDNFEPFHPDRIASQILGMGDILSLVEEAERNVDEKKAKKLAKKLRKGGFDLEDFREQLEQMNNMGGMMGIASKIPGLSGLPEMAQNTDSDKTTGKIIAIINSMTPKERAFPKLIQGSRKKRIARGSGTEIQDVNRLLKQFKQMEKMMKKMGKPGGMKKMMRGLSGMLPPGGLNH